MASINRLKPGQIVWSIERQKIGNTAVRRGALFQVTISEVHEDYVLASWNGNPVQRFGLAAVKKWRVNKPEPKGLLFGLPNYK